jgi:hypothetical protein
MHRYFPQLALGLTIALAACAHRDIAGFKETQLPRPTAQELLDANEQRLAAMTQPDLEALQSMLDDSLVFTHSNGVAQTKAELLDAFRRGTITYRKIRTEEAQARPFPGGGTITGRVRIIVGKDSPAEMVSRFTAVLLNTEGHFKLIAYESTRIQ